MPYEGTARSTVFTDDNQLPGTSFTFDGNGNPTQYNSVTPFAYDTENRLLSINGLSFAADYDADDLRTFKATGLGNRYYIYDGATRMLELDSSGVVKDANQWGADGLRALYDSTGTGQFYQYTFDPEGNRSQRQSQNNTSNYCMDTSVYDAFGLLLGKGIAAASPGNESQMIGFAGQFGGYTDLDQTNSAYQTGLVYMTHRYYDAGQGRFLNRDPIKYNGGLNLYAYAGNNPVNGIDPSGLEPSGPDTRPYAAPAAEDTTPVSEPGFGESLIPVWGSGKSAVHDFQTGHPFWGTFNTAMAISDIFLVKAAVADVAKVGFKGLVKVGGSHTWGATKKWMVKQGWRDFSGQPFHHWALQQGQGIGKRVPDIIKNQPWNITRISGDTASRLGGTAQDLHNAIHGNSTVIQLNPLMRLWYGVPTWARAGTVSGLGRAANELRK